MILHAKDDVDRDALDRSEAVAGRGGWRVGATESIDATWEALRVERDPSDA